MVYKILNLRYGQLTKGLCNLSHLFQNNKCFQNNNNSPDIYLKSYWATTQEWVTNVWHQFCCNIPLLLPIASCMLQCLQITNYIGWQITCTWWTVCQRFLLWLDVWIFDAEMILFINFFLFLFACSNKKRHQWEDTIFLCWSNSSKQCNLCSYVNHLYSHNFCYFMHILGSHLYTCY